MKTSNKLLIAIGVLMIASIILFDTALRAEYIKGDYKKPNYGLIAVPVKDFDAIEDSTSNKTYLDVSYGDKFEVWIGKPAEKDLVFTVKDHLLKISFKNIKSDREYAHTIHIKCPRLNSFSTNISNGDKNINNYGVTTIGWFNQDSLRITSLAPGTISVAGRYKKLNILNYWGEVGVGGCQVDTANFDIRGESSLNLYNAQIVNANYKLDERAKVTLSGLTAKQFIH